MNYAFSVTSAIAHGNPDRDDEDGLDGMCSAAKSGGYCAAKITRLIKTLALRVLQHPLTLAVPVRFRLIDHTLFMQRKQRP